MWKKLKAALSVGVTWAAGWGVWGVATTIAMHFFGMGVTRLSAANILNAFANWGLTGFVGGAAFAGLLSVAYRGRTLGELRPSLVGLLGACAATGVLVALSGPGVFLAKALAAPGEAAVMALLVAVPGLMIAGTTLRLAQRSFSEITGAADGPALRKGAGHRSELVSLPPA